MLPSGLASISSRLDDSPNVRGAVAFGRMVREARSLATTGDQQTAAAARRFPEGGTAAMRTAAAVMNSLIDRHAQLAVSAGYRSADRR